MELFAISCTTCQARLKVRDMAAIGKILACPKCQSMVQVLPPPGWQPPAGTPGAGAPAPTATPATSSITESLPTGLTIKVSAATIAEIRAAAPPAMAGSPPGPTPQASSTPPSEPASRPAERSVARTQPTAAQSAAQRAVVEPISVPYEQINPNDIPPVPMPEWRDGVGARIVVGLGRRRVLAIAAPVAAMLIALLAWIMLRPGSEAKMVAAPSAAATGNGADSDLVSFDQALVPADASNPEAATPVDTGAPESGSTVAVEEATGEQHADAEALAADPDAAIDPAAGEEMPDTDVSGGQDRIAASPAKRPADTNTPPQGEVSADRDPALARPNVTRPTDDAPATESTTDSAPPLDPESTDDDLLVGQESRPAIDVAARLADPIPGLQLKPTPLADFCDFLARLSTVPITLDTEALAAAGQHVTDSVSISIEDTTVGDVLTQVLAKRRLIFITTDRQVLVTTADAQSEKVTTATYDVHDLATDKGETGHLAALVTRFVAPASWDQRGGQGRLSSNDGELAVEQRPLVQRSVALFLDKLRITRGLRTSGVQPAPNARPEVALQTKYTRAKANLDDEVTANFSAPSPLGDVLAWLARSTKTRILIDEASLAEAGLWSRSPASVVADHQPLRDVLTALLTPVGMTYRIVDEKTVQVFARRDLPSRLEVEMFPVENLLAGHLEPDVMVARLRERLGPLANEGSGLTTIEVDTAGKYLLAAASPEALIRLETLLVRASGAARPAK